jgi:hypothetical protein
MFIKSRALTSTLLIALLFSTLSCTKRDRNYSKNSGGNGGEGLSIEMPLESEAQSLKDVQDGIYKISEITTYVSGQSNGYPLSAYFSHTVLHHGNPSEGDIIETQMIAQPKSGYIVQISPELNIPLSITSDANEMTFNDIRYYWNYVRSDDDWRWRLSPSESTSDGFDVFDLFKNGVEDRPGVFFKSALSYTSYKGIVTATETRINLYVEWTTGENHKAIAKLVFTKSYKDDYLSPSKKKKLFTKEQAKSPAPAPATPAPVTKNEIRLTRDEVSISNIQTGAGGIAYDNNGIPTRLTSVDEVRDYGVRNGYAAQTVDHAIEISRKNEGIVGFAQNSVELTATIRDLVGHMKKQMNANADGLELVFAIDYSGSMENNIQAVIADLKKLTQSFTNLLEAGRTISIGIVTFGKTGKEKLELSLTRDLARVQSTLQRLLDQYNTNTHYDEPGEACYGGLSCAATGMAWTSKNRQIIVITDEGSKELAEGRINYIADVEQQLGQARVYPVIVRLSN